MDLIRRLLGKDPPDVAATGAAADTAAGVPDDAERAREIELLREDQARMDNLIRRQQRYAGYAWQPPPEGGERRADDGTDTEAWDHPAG